MIENALEQVEQLRKVQDLDSQMLEFERAKGDIPQKLEQLEAERERDRADINTAKAKREKLESERRQLEKEIAFDRESFKKFEEKIQTLDSNEAYQAAQKELDGRKQIIRQKEEEALRLMEEAETISKKISQLEADFSEIGKKYEEQEAELKKRVDQIEKDTADLRAQREEAAKDIDKGLLSKYEQIFKRRDGIGVVSVVNEICQGCFMGIPPQLVNNARAGREGVQVCPNCHRIIYWAPQDSPE